MISGERPAPERAEQDQGFRRRFERRFGKFSRTFSVRCACLPPGAACTHPCGGLGSEVASGPQSECGYVKEHAASLRSITMHTMHARASWKPRFAGAVTSIPIVPGCLSPAMSERGSDAHFDGALQLPENAELTGITARFENGVLTVSLRACSLHAHDMR